MLGTQTYGEPVVAPRGRFCHLSSVITIRTIRHLPPAVPALPLPGTPCAGHLQT